MIIYVVLLEINPGILPFSLSTYFSLVPTVLYDDVMPQYGDAYSVCRQVTRIADCHDSQSYFNRVKECME